MANCTYQVIAKTRTDKYADTDSKIYIQIIGSAGKTDSVRLDRSNYDDFERNKTDSYIFEQVDVGTIQQIRLTGGGDAWFFEWIEVREPESGQVVNFYGYALDSNNKLQRLSLGSSAMVLEPTELFTYELKVKISSQKYSDTDSAIYALFPEALAEGADPRLYTFRLDNPNFDDFERGHINSFTLKTIFSLSEADKPGAPIKMTMKISGTDGLIMDWMQLEQQGTRNVWSFIPDSGNRLLDDHASQVYESGDAYTYLIKAKTGVVENAGTDATVMITLKDAGGKSASFYLDNAGRDDFRRYKTDTFSVMSAVEFTDITSVTVEVSGESDAWYPDWLEVKPTYDSVLADVRWTFPAYRWISRGSPVQIQESPMQDFRILAKTKSTSHSGTDDAVFITLIDKNGLASNELMLDSARDDFEAMNTDTFYVRSDKVLAELKEIKLRLAGDDGWRVEWVQVDDLSVKGGAPVSYNFPCYASGQTMGYLLDNNASKTFPAGRLTSFVVSVKTGATKHADTDAPVNISLTDTHGKVITFPLDSAADDFKKGSVGTYYFKTTESFGTLKFINLNVGSGDAWLVDWLGVDVDGANYPFYIYDWIPSPGKRLDYLNTRPNVSFGELQEIADYHAPRLRLHTEERFLPSSVEYFIERSRLIDEDGRLLPMKLDGLPGNGRSYHLAAISDGSNGGDLSNAKVYVNFKGLSGSYIDIQYWYFYPYNGCGRAKIQTLIANQSVKTSVVGLGTLGEHEGDWEHVTLRLDLSQSQDAQLKAIYLAQHAHGKWLPTSEFDIDRSAGCQPIVYSSKNGHASYQKSGDNATHYLRLPPGITGFFSFLSPPAVATRLLNSCNNGPELNGRGRLVAIGVNELDSGAFQAPSWVEFEGRWGAGSENELTDQAVREMLLPVLLAATSLAMLVPGYNIALVKFLLAATAVIAIAPTKVLPVEENVPSEVAKGNGPRGPVTKSSWRGEE